MLPSELQFPHLSDGETTPFSVYFKGENRLGSAVSLIGYGHSLVLGPITLAITLASEAPSLLASDWLSLAPPFPGTAYAPEAFK